MSDIVARFLIRLVHELSDALGAEWVISHRNLLQIIPRRLESVISSTKAGQHPAHQLNPILLVEDKSETVYVQAFGTSH